MFSGDAHSERSRYLGRYPAICIFSRAFEGGPVAIMRTPFIERIPTPGTAAAAESGAVGPGGAPSHGERLHGRAVRSGLAII